MSNRKVVTYFLILLAAIAGFWIGVVLRLVRMGNPRPSGPVLLAQFVDVGDGDAAIFDSPGGLSILVDTGPDDSGASEIVTQMHRLKITAPSVIVLTSARERSIGGLSYVLTHSDFHGPIVLPCEPKLFSRLGGVSARDAVSAAGRAHVPLVSEASFESAPQHVLLGDANTAMTLIPVQPPLLRPRRARRQPISDLGALAVRLDYGSHGVFYAAGLTPQEEDQLIASRVRLPCDILAVSDGGSLNSTSSELLALAGPRIAVISTSTDTQPDPQVLDRLAAAAATIYRTDAIGSLTLAIGSNPAYPITLYGPQSALPTASRARNAAPIR